MIFNKLLLPLTIVACAGCLDDVPTLHVTATAMHAVELAPPDDQIPAAFGHYRWELVVEPPLGNDPSPTAESAAITITPTTRGIYVYDRWFVGEAAAQLSYHVVVTVEGNAPIAGIVGPTMAAVGAATTLDGSPSVSAEGRPLSFQWRLALRPESSTTVLGDSDDETLMLVPDVTGEYGIELRVFDGELWSRPAVLALTAR